MNSKYYKLFIIIFIILFIFLIINILLQNDILYDKNKKSDLEKDGFFIFKNILSEDELKKIKEQCKNNEYKIVKENLINNFKINEIINKNIGINHQFQDYIFIIKKSSIHTCHRDNNGDFFNKGQKYPSYTGIIFLEKMEKCLGLIPKSHKNINSFGINIKNRVVNILCNPGDMIIFNANLIHVGTLNKKDDHLRIQMKITHKEDIDKIFYYNNYNKILNENNKLPSYIKKYQKNLSCSFPIFSVLSQKIIEKNSTKNNNTKDFFKNSFAYLFNGDSNFYNFKNAF